MALCITACTFFSCSDGDEKDTDDTTDIVGADTSDIPDIPDNPDNGGEVVKGPVPDVPTGENTVVVSSAELLAMIKDGSIAKNGDYAVTDGEYLTFTAKDNNKTYDLKNALIRIGVRTGEIGIDFGTAKGVTLQNGKIAVYGGTAIGASKSRSCVVKKVNVTGNAEAGINVGGRLTEVNGCTVLPDEGGVISEAIVGTGTDGSVTNCNIEGVKKGIVDRSENGLVVENNKLKNCDVGVSSEAPSSVIWYNNIDNCKCGVSAEFDKSELAATLSNGYNVMAAQNVITKCDTSISFVNVSNGVVLLNKATKISVSGGTNMYVNENDVSDGTLVLKDNDYIIANENKYKTLDKDGNTNTNGDDLTNLDARVTTGVNEALLPHINTEQFTSMSRQSKVRSLDAEFRLDEYIKDEIGKTKVVIIPPGAYTSAELTLSGLDSVKIYAYGVISEIGISQWNSEYTFKNCTNCELKGIFISTSMYTSTQGTVISAGTGTNGWKIKFITDPGYRENFGDGSCFGATAVGFYYTNGNTIPETDFSYAYENGTAKSYDKSTGINTLDHIRNSNIKVGDRVAFRTDFGGGAVSISGGSNMLIEDVTVFSVSGFASTNSNCDIAPTYHRYAVVSGPAPVLDSSKTYNEIFDDMLWTDDYGRLRSSVPMLTSCDATHSSGSRTGIQIISCLFENIGDDAGNIGAHYGLASSFDASTKTLTYTTCDVNGYNLLPNDFRVGDDLIMYDWDGKLVYTGKITKATQSLGNDMYSVKVEGDMTLPSDIRVVVQNLSASERGFLIDNVKVNNATCNAFRIKAPGGTVKNCTFNRISKGGLNFIPEYQGWPEVGFAMNVDVLNNVFNETGYTSRNANAATDSTWCAPICIRFSLNNDKADKMTDTDYLRHQNIKISGNVFSNRYCPYAISAGCVNGLEIRANTFTARKDNATDTQKPILIFGGNNITVSDNAYPTGMTSFIDYRNGSGSASVGGNNA